MVSLKLNCSIKILLNKNRGKMFADRFHLFVYCTIIMSKNDLKLLTKRQQDNYKLEVGLW